MLASLFHSPCLSSPPHLQKSQHNTSTGYVASSPLQFSPSISSTHSRLAQDFQTRGQSAKTLLEERHSSARFAGKDREGDRYQAGLTTMPFLSPASPPLGPLSPLRRRIGTQSPAMRSSGEAVRVSFCITSQCKCCSARRTLTTNGCPLDSSMQEGCHAAIGAKRRTSSKPSRKLSNRWT